MANMENLKSGKDQVRGNTAARKTISQEIISSESPEKMAASKINLN